MIKRFIFILVAGSLLSGCATMESDLSCNITASDSCMTISQVDSMSESKASFGKNRSSRAIKGSNSIDRKTLSEQNILISPWVDENGQSHSGENLALSNADEGLS